MTLIKRYPNRRLYDTETSQYITLEDLARLVHEGREVRIIDSKNGEDLTRRVLVQVLLLDDQAHKLDCLPVDFLRTLIKLEERSMMKLFEHYVGTTLQTFTIAQKAMQQNLELLQKMSPAPADLLGSILSRFRPQTSDGEPR
jgi:polyhydroxyalkanoate synthesis repressor PhaR